MKQTVLVLSDNSLHRNEELYNDIVVLQDKIPQDNTTSCFCIPQLFLTNLGSLV